jgi:hypothetical protein
MLAPLALVACGFDATGTGDGLVLHKDTGVEELVDSGATDTLVAPTEDVAVTDPADTAPVFDAESPLPGCTAAARASHEYLFCELEANWDQARTTCKLAGYDLVVIADKAEHDWILERLNAKSRGKWHIGLTDRDKEGTFKWVDGSSPAFTSWGSWQPDDWLWSEDCVMTSKDGSWNDGDCGDTMNEGFICESF